VGGPAPLDVQNQPGGNHVSEHRPGSTTPEAGWYVFPDNGTVLRWWSGDGWTDQYAPMADDADAVPAPATETADAAADVAAKEPAADPAYGPAAARPKPAMSAEPAGPPPAPGVAAAAAVALPTSVDTLEPSHAVAPAASGYAAYPVATPNPRLRWGNVSVWLLAFSPWLTMASAIAAFYVYASTPDADAIPYWIPALVVPHALTTGLAVLDGRRLREWQHPRVPHWAWSLPGVPVYLIVRAVVLRHVTVRSTAPLWVAVLNIALTWLLFFVAFFLVGALVLYVIQSLSDSMSGIN
jgi:hypothetical protein